MRSQAWAPVAVGLLFFAICAAWLSHDTRRAREAFPPGSALNTGPRGLSLARAWLSARGADVLVLERELDPAALPKDALVLRVEPIDLPQLSGGEELLEPLERDGGAADAGARDAGEDAPADAGPDGEDADDWLPNDLDAGPSRRGESRAHLRLRFPRFDPFALSDADEEFVRRGGALVIAADGETGSGASDEQDHDEDDARNADAGDHGGSAQDEASAEDGGSAPAAGGMDDGGAGAAASSTEDGPEDEEREPEPEKVLPLLPGVRDLALPRGRSLPPPLMLLDAQPVFERQGAPALALRRLGAGVVWFIDTPRLFENGALAKGDHLALLAALVGSRRPVILDERAHGLGEESGLGELFRAWHLMPALLIAALAALLLFWRRATTLGPPADGWRDTRSEALDFVDSAAALFERALTPEGALTLYRTHLVREISLRLGLTADAAARRLDALAKGAPALKPGAPVSARELQLHLQLLTQAIERFRDEHPRFNDAADAGSPRR